MGVTISVGEETEDLIQLCIVVLGVKLSLSTSDVEESVYIHLLVEAGWRANTANACLQTTTTGADVSSSIQVRHAKRTADT